MDGVFGTFIFRGTARSRPGPISYDRGRTIFVASLQTHCSSSSPSTDVVNYSCHSGTTHNYQHNQNMEVQHGAR